MIFIESSGAFEAMIDLIYGRQVDGIDNGDRDVGVVDMYWILGVVSNWLDRAIG